MKNHPPGTLAVDGLFVRGHIQRLRNLIDLLVDLDCGNPRVFKNMTRSLNFIEEYVDNREHIPAQMRRSVAKPERALKPR